MKTYSSMNHMWAGACKHLLDRGRRQPSRAGGTVEAVGWSGRLTDVDHSVLLSPLRKMDPAYACAELLWYLSRRDSVEMMCAYAPSYRKFANPPSPNGRAHGAYGHRWANNPGFVARRRRESHGHDQLDAVVHLLRARPDSRQAVVVMWDSADIGHAIDGDKNDIPCTLSLQFLLRDGALHAVATMRSNDVWLGMPYDVFCFTSVQRIVARCLKVRAGDYVHNVGSLHAYDRNLDGQLDLARAADEVEPSVGNGWDELDGKPQRDSAWSAADGEASEEEARTAKSVKGVTFRPGGPPGDAAIVCASKVCPDADNILFRGHCSSPALLEAWRLKYGGGTD